uniref:Uncharacterized protein n=1 Tax=Lepeophtheirus salmonis TaxID=72036 RepID=A0A0K2VA32_LEPSM
MENYSINKSPSVSWMYITQKSLIPITFISIPFISWTLLYTKLDTSSSRLIVLLILSHLALENKWNMILD